MRKLLIGLTAAAALVLYQPWRYRWAFGRDAGAARAEDWKEKPCSQELAKALYSPAAETEIASREGNRFFYPGRPGHWYYVYGFRLQASCEAARRALGAAQWDQSAGGPPTAPHPDD